MSADLEPESTEPPAPDDRDHRRSAGLRRERSAASRQFADGLFRNTTVAPPGVQGGFLPMFGELLFGGQQRRPPAPLPLERPHAAWAQRPDTGFRATWLGHSTVLLELDGRRVLTDPVFGKRVSPVAFLGPRRFHPVPAELAELPALDLVLLSHDHFDHLCKPTMQALARMTVPIVTALGVGAHLERYGIAPSRITELDWHESIERGGLRLTAQPAQHFSGRELGGRNKTLWASWVIQSERRKVFFSGDTGLTPEFEAIGRTHGPFDLVMLEIGAYHPSWGSIHLGPEHALEAFRMLGGGALLPVHWGTFSLAFHAWSEPAETLLEHAGKSGARILTPRLGAAFEPEQLDGPSPWWREVRSRREQARLAPVLDPP
ncbi:MAG TPA: MBL fold metallo-hydrolase [Kofleriaceae bacterium]|jgi:L-ascorbate metabolism protein UlaG (beta-lactamase superfamily)|nr:MBL fold metallo-hydrolase [Kofleriaceae bacterium]